MVFPMIPVPLGFHSIESRKIHLQATNNRQESEGHTWMRGVKRKKNKKRRHEARISVCVAHLLIHVV